MKKLNVCVVGGGIGGAATAASLAAAGANVTLLERAHELREIGAGIFLKANSLRVLRELDILENLAQQGSWIREGQIWGSDARPLSMRSIPAGAVLTVRREDIHQALVGCANRFGVEVVTDSRVVSVADTGAVRTENQPVQYFDLVVGADGVNSTVRDSIGMTAQVAPTGAGSWRALAPSKPTDPKAKVIEFWRGRRRVLVVPAGPNLTYLCASSRDDDPVLASASFDNRAWASVFPEFSDLIHRVDPSGMVRRQHVKVTVRGWYRGKVAILGDAVHGQPPNLGQGAGCAIANGAALSECLRSAADLGAGLQTWEEKQRLLTEEVQSWSNLYDSVVHGWPAPLEFGRNLLLKGVVRFAPTRDRWSRLSAGLAAGAH